MNPEPYYIIENKYRIKQKDGSMSKEFSSFYQYSLMGNHKDGANCYGQRSTARKFDSKVKATRIARELGKMRPNESYKVVEMLPATEPKSISYEAAASFGDPTTIDPTELNESISTLDRLQKEYFPNK